MDLKKLLQEFNLLELFQDKLMRQDLFAKFPCVLKEKQDTSQSNLFSKFVSDLLHYNSNCRYIDVKPQPSSQYGVRARMQNLSSLNTDTNVVHPLDLSTLLFLCCHPIARQDIVDRFWTCRHAFPFIIQLEQLSAPKLYAWPFRSLIANSDDSEFSDREETEISRLKFKVVSFVRFSESDISKSSILNLVLNRSTKGSSVFFHRNCIGSAMTRCEIIEGMVEVFPYIYSAQGGGPVLYLNLRGNAQNFYIQRSYLLSVSQVTVILLEKKDLKNVNSFITRNVARNGSSKILLLTDIPVDADADTKQLLEELPHDVISVPIRGMRTPAIIEVLWDYISKCKLSSSFEDCVSNAREWTIDVDEEDMRENLHDAENVSKIVKEKYQHRNETLTFPVQGDEYLQAAKAEIEFYKLRDISKSETVRTYREHLKQVIYRCREAQYRLSLKPSLTTCLTERNGNVNFDIFLRSFKLHLEHLSRVNVNKLYKEYKALFTRMRISDHEKSSERWNIKLKELDNRMNSNAISILNFIREMGQIFESQSWNFDRDNKIVPVPKTINVKAAVRILLCGNPIEIMDGRSCSVPIEWVKAVFTELFHEIGNSRLMIVSVLGIESSGKSTLLNVMFGCTFPVGSGRCTRGVYIYLLKVSNSVTGEHAQVDYVLVVDTEGLFSSATYIDEAGIRDKQERELATFVIGLSNITLINIMGENVDYLKDILPISVYAFLRMNLVGLNPKCKIIHHAVDRSRRSTLGWQAKIFEIELDKYTEEACNLENVSTRQFKEVIQFDPAVDVHYFPPLFEANAQETDYHDSFSHFYSREAMKLKDNLLHNESATRFNDLIRNTERLWNAVKRENFVFEFRNILDAEARAILEYKLCDFQWRIRTNIQNKMIPFHEAVSKSSSIEGLKSIKERCSSDLQYYVQSEQESFLRSFDNHDECDTVLSKALMKLRRNFNQDLVKVSGECMEEAEDILARDITLRCREIEFKIGDRRTEQSVDRYIENVLKGDGSDISDMHFDEGKHFENWAYTELSIACVMHKDQMEYDAMESLDTVFYTNRTAVDNIQHLLAKDLETFVPVRDHWPRELHEIMKIEAECAKSLIKKVRKYCLEVMNNIRHRKRFYHRKFFREIVLFVKNERQRCGKNLKCVETFEVELAAAACSHLLKQLAVFDNEKGLLSFNMITTIKSYFMSKLLDKRKDITPTKNIIEGCCNIIENSIVEQSIVSSTANSVCVLANRILYFMKDHYSFFRSKLGLLCFVWKQLVLDNDSFQLQEYLTHPLAKIRSTVSELFDRDISEIGRDSQSHTVLLDKIIKPFVSEQMENICQLLQTDSLSEQGYSLNNFGEFLQFLAKKLEPYLDFADSSKYRRCRVDISDADVFIQMLTQKLRSNLFQNCLVDKMHLTVLEKNMVHDDIRLQVVNSIYTNTIGCEETCRICGTLCCGQKWHAGPHIAFMHMPTGFRDIFSKDKDTVSADTCFNAFECVPELREELSKSNWLNPDESLDEDKFWKYMFAKHVREIARNKGKNEPGDIPESWCRLTQCEILHWLDKQIEDEKQHFF